MKLLFIRHAAAVPRGTPGVLDDERPLTPKGKAKFRVAARGLARITRRPDVLLTSPLPRARPTAEIAARAFKRVEPAIEPALAHKSLDGIVAALGAHRPATVAIVGHEPLSGRSWPACSAPRTVSGSRSRRAARPSWTCPMGPRPAGCSLVPEAEGSEGARGRLIRWDAGKPAPKKGGAGRGRRSRLDGGPLPACPSQPRLRLQGARGGASAHAAGRRRARRPAAGGDRRDAPGRAPVLHAVLAERARPARDRGRDVGRARRPQPRAAARTAAPQGGDRRAGPERARRGEARRRSRARQPVVQGRRCRGPRRREPADQPGAGPQGGLHGEPAAGHGADHEPLCARRSRPRRARSRRSAARSAPSSRTACRPRGAARSWWAWAAPSARSPASISGRTRASASIATGYGSTSPTSRRSASAWRASPGGSAGRSAASRRSGSTSSWPGPSSSRRPWSSAAT